MTVLPSARRILLVSLSNIGDAVLTTPVLAVLHRQWPSAEITVLVGPRAVPIFERDPRVARVMPYDKHASCRAKWRLMLALRRHRFDVAVDLRHSALPWLVGARWRSAMVRDPQEVRHRTQHHLAVLQRMGIPVDGARPRVIVGAEDEAVAAQWLADLPANRGVVALAPGARSHLKRWTEEGFARAGDQCMADGFQIVLVGDAQERAIAERVARRMSRPPLNLAGRTTLRQLAALFSYVRLVVTNDSACLHLAVAVDTPVVAIFGPTDPRKYGPTGPRDRVVQLQMVCGPCERALCPYGHECLQQLSASEVVAAARQVLAS